ncbi:DUF4270 domain-containing protein [Salinimicrobium soli]|uniref:DUF4270 domain-containing protein n=1 Tax=Salinimicrobium soli TaxID=1254399 RepID=UPI003AAFD651
MTIKNTMLKITTVVAVVFSFVACEDDFETIGSGVIGEPGFNTGLYEDAEISAINNDLAPVQTNNLPLNLLGVYTDPVFGSQKASIVTQLSMAQTNPSFGNQPELDSVVLTIPYFSHVLETLQTGETVYKLDSVYGNSAIKLSILESNYFLNNYDPSTDFEQAQKYYSNLTPQIESNLTGNVLYQNDNFRPSPAELIEINPGATANRDTLRLAPRMRLKLSVDFFKSKIIDMEGAPELASQANFRNYFRSLYFKAEQIGNKGSMMLLNLAEVDAGIILYYRSKIVDATDSDGDGDTTDLVDVNKSFKLNFGPTKVTTFDQESPQFTEGNLYLKGGEGSMAIIDLFSGADTDGDGVSDELEFLRDSEWLINEANLTFYVNRNFMTGLDEPERIYLYDLDNSAILADYVLDDPGQLNSLTSTSNENHLVPLKRDESGKGISYKVNITDHINNVLNNEETNVRLGLVVTQNVNIVGNSAVLQTEGANVQKIPAGSVITPQATVLYGPNAEDADKRLKLKIYYTEPKN